MKWLVFLSLLLASCLGQQAPSLRKKPAESKRGRPQATKPKEPVVEDEVYYDDYYSDVANDPLCKEPFGFYPDEVQCDKYYQCKEGQIVAEKLCADGMGFIEYHPTVERCDFLFNVDCTTRPELQPAKSSVHCPRENGYFANEDPAVCDKFYYCHGGTASELPCAQSLVFDPNSGTCSWPETAKREGCSSEDVYSFTCPTQTTSLHGELHPRYPDPEDCQFFYVCLNGKTPRKNGCMFGQAFNTKTGACNEAKDVYECRDWYIGDPKYDAYLEGIRSRQNPTTAPPVQKKRRRPPTPPVEENVPTQYSQKARRPSRPNASRQPVSVLDLVAKREPVSVQDVVADRQSISVQDIVAGIGGQLDEPVQEEQPESRPSFGGNFRRRAG